MAFSAVANEGSSTDYRLLIEPSFAYPPLSWPIAGAKETLIVPARLIDGKLQYLTANEFSHTGLSRQEFEQVALKNASQTLAQLKPTFIRGQEGVILYAVLESSQPLTASTALAPDFAKLFENTIGPDFLIAMPNRFRVYIFPRQFAPMARIADDVAMDFRATAYPVSKEVFVLHNGALSCIGVLQ